MSQPTSERVYFEEEQRFRQVWVRVLFITAGVLPLGVAIWALVQQLGYGVTFGKNALSNGGLVTFATLFILLSVGLTWLIFSCKLRTLVRADGLFVRFSPFHRKDKQLGPERLLRWAVRDYRPLREYGGWGIRYGTAGKAYNVSGHRGVQLEYSNGERVLIGSDRAEELCSAIDEMMRAPHP